MCIRDRLRNSGTASGQHDFKLRAPERRCSFGKEVVGHFFRVNLRPRLNLRSRHAQNAKSLH
eukprot:11908329-Alexandrium_andersonii.AAC.1